MCDECPSIKKYNMIRELLPELNIPEYEPIFTKLDKCDHCKQILLCQKHKSLAFIFGKYYLNKENYILCDKCSSTYIFHNVYQKKLTPYQNGK